MSSEKPLSKYKSVSSLAIVCFFFGLTIIAVTAFQWDLVDYLTPFLMGPLILCCWAGFLGLSITSMLYLALQYRKNLARAILPLLFNGVTFLILSFVPFTTIRFDLEFRMNYRDYTKVIEMVNVGSIQPDEYGQARLPSEYRHVSRDGDIIITSSDGVTSVFFYTYRGVLDNFSGYMYRSNDMPPPHDYMGGDWAQIIRKRTQWFFCASR